jgi:hypothetical protein
MIFYPPCAIPAAIFNGRGEELGLPLGNPNNLQISTPFPRARIRLRAPRMRPRSPRYCGHPTLGGAGHHRRDPAPTPWTCHGGLRRRGLRHESPQDPRSRLIPIATKFVTVLIFNAGLHAGTGTDLIKVVPFAPIGRSVPAVAINIIVVPTPISVHRLTIFILVDHVPHLALTHAIHFPPFLGALFCPRVLGARGLAVGSLFRLLRYSRQFTRGVLALIFP